MVCRAGTSYSGDDDANFRGKNWNGDVQFAPAKLARPRDLKSLVELVAKATEDGQPLHVVGSGWSFEDCASTDGVMVSLNRLTKRLSYLVDDNRQLLVPRWTAVPQVGPGGRLVHFEAGIRIAALCEELDAGYLALPTLGGSNGQALAGVISTSTHGGDWNQPPFPDIVRAVHLVFAGGQEVWIESDTDPLTRSDVDQELLAILPCADTKIVRDDRIFNAVRVACGRFGVIYSVVLEVRTQFRVAQVVTTPSHAAVMQALRDGQGMPSVFTPLLRMLNNDPVPAAMSDAKGVPYFFQILFNALRPSDVWVTRRWETPGDLPDNVPGPAQSMKDIAIGVTVALHTALGTAAGLAAPTTATVGEIVGALIGLPGLGAVLSATTTSTVVAALTETTARLDAMIARGNFNAGVLIASAIDSLWKIPGMSALIAEIEYLTLNGRLPRTGRGPHYLMTSGTRADSDQTDFVSDSLEVVFDATTADYLGFLDEVLAISPLFPQAGYVSMRPSLSSKASLSMHNVGSARAVSFELASIKPLAGNFAWLMYCHHAAVRRNGRPHWGQFNKMQTLDTAMLYGNSLNNWREGLLALQRITQRADSSIFSNAFTRQRGLEPVGIARDVTSVKKKHGTITHLCNDAASWSPVTVAQAIEDIRAGTVHYFALRDDSRASIVVVSDGHGGFHLRTRADNTSRNNLDMLPVSTM
ncbi:MAG: FAD-binding protein [Steroidobacteraceae bacterium]